MDEESQITLTDYATGKLKKKRKHRHYTDRKSGKIIHRSENYYLDLSNKKKNKENTKTRLREKALERLKNGIRLSETIDRED